MKENFEDSIYSIDKFINNNFEDNFPSKIPEVKNKSKFKYYSNLDEDEHFMMRANSYLDLGIYESALSQCRAAYQINSIYKKNLLDFLERIYISQKDFQTLKIFSSYDQDYMIFESFIDDISKDFFFEDEFDEFNDDGENDFFGDFEDIDFEELEKQLSNGINLYKNNFILYYCRGCVYYSLAEYELALEDFEKVIQVIKESFIPKLIPNLKISRILDDKEISYLLEDLIHYYCHENTRNFLLDYSGNLTCWNVINLFNLQYSFKILIESNFLIKQISKLLKINLNNDKILLIKHAFYKYKIGILKGEEGQYESAVRYFDAAQRINKSKSYIYINDNSSNREIREIISQSEAIED